MIYLLYKFDPSHIIYVPIKCGGSFVKKLVLMTVAFVMAAVFVYGQFDAYTDFYNYKSLKFMENTSIPSVYKHSKYSLYKKHSHKNSERVKQGVVFVSEEFKKPVQTGFTEICFAKAPQALGFYSGDNYSYAGVKGAGDFLILKTRK